MALRHRQEELEVYQCEKEATVGQVCEMQEVKRSQYWAHVSARKISSRVSEQEEEVLPFRTVQNPLKTCVIKVLKLIPLHISDQCKGTQREATVCPILNGVLRIIFPQPSFEQSQYPGYLHSLIHFSVQHVFHILQIDRLCAHKMEWVSR